MEPFQIEVIFTRQST